MCSWQLHNNLCVIQDDMAFNIQLAWKCYQILSCIEIFLCIYIHTHTHTHTHTRALSLSLYRVFQGESAILRQNVAKCKLLQCNQKYLHPKLNGYGDTDVTKTWSSCGSANCICLAWCVIRKLCEIFFPNQCLLLCSDANYALNTGVNIAVTTESSEI